MSNNTYNEIYKNEIERTLNAFEYLKWVGQITYNALREEAAGGEAARGIWYKAKTNMGGRVWYTPDGSEAVAETPAGAVYGKMFLDGMPDAEKHKRIYASLCEGCEMPSMKHYVRYVCGRIAEPWEWDTKAQAWAKVGGQKMYVGTNKGLIMGLALWEDFREL